MRFLLIALLPLAMPLWAAEEAAAPPPAADIQGTAPAEAAPAPEGQPAPEVAALQEFLGDQKTAEEKLRAFRKEQVTVIDEAMEKLDRMKVTGQTEGAAELAQDVQRRWALLRQAFELALDRQPNSAVLNNYYGEILYDAYGDMAGGLKAWNKAIGLDSKVSTPYNNLAMHYFHNGEYKQALSYIDKALDLEPKNPDYLLNLSDAYLVYGEEMAKLRESKLDKIYKDAMKMSKTAMKEAPGDIELMQNYAINFWKAEDFGVEADWKEPAEVWQAIRPLAKYEEQTFFSWINEARCWLKAGKFEKAEACAAEALKLRPDSKPAQTVLSRAQAGGKDNKQAAE